MVYNVLSNRLHSSPLSQSRELLVLFFSTARNDRPRSLELYASFPTGNLLSTGLARTAHTYTIKLNRRRPRRLATGDGQSR